MKGIKHLIGSVGITLAGLLGSYTQVEAKDPPVIQQEGKYEYTNLQTLIEHPELLSRSPITLTGFERFNLDQGVNVLVQQDFGLDTTFFLIEYFSLKFEGDNKSKVDAYNKIFNFSANLEITKKWLNKAGINHKELIDYLDKFKALSENQYTGNFELSILHDFQPSQQRKRTSLDDFIEQNIIEPCKAKYTLSEKEKKLLTPIIQESLNNKLPVKEAIIKAIQLLGKKLTQYHLPTTNYRSIEQALQDSTISCGEAGQYTAQIIDSLLKPNNENFIGIYALPVQIEYPSKNSKSGTVVTMLVDTNAQKITFIDQNHILNGINTYDCTDKKIILR